MKLDTIDEFMDAGAEYGVSFKIEADETGFRFAVGWPHDMPSEARRKMQAWVNAHDAELAERLMSMAKEIQDGAMGTTVIHPETLH